MKSLFSAVRICLLALMQACLAHGSSLPGDNNKDGFVGADDLLILRQNWHRGARPSGEFFTVNFPEFPAGARPLRMVRIPAGTFFMGADNERGGGFFESPRHQVTITQDFFMGETEVTQAQWRAVMGTLPENLKGGVGDDYPVFKVSWNAIQDFLTVLNGLGVGIYRLPTEAEWEYACRAGTVSPPDRFFFGPNLLADDSCGPSALADQYMWWCGNNSPIGVKPVAQKLPNAFGLFDTHGNVYEWCHDFYQADFYSTPEATAPNPLCVNSSSGTRVLRGGSWSIASRFCRSATRSSSTPGFSRNDIGFRLMRQP